MQSLRLQNNLVINSCFHKEVRILGDYQVLEGGDVNSIKIFNQYNYVIKNILIMIRVERTGRFE